MWVYYQKKGSNSDLRSKRGKVVMMETEITKSNNKETNHKRKK